MIIQISHLTGFVVLLAAAYSDLKTTEVPDWLSMTGVFAGIFLHAAAAVQQGSFQPLIWSLGVGSVFSAYGWGMYYMGMWGGADAFATSILGFAAPYAISGPSLAHPVNLFVNLMIVGFVYTLVFAAYSAFRNREVLQSTLSRFKEQKLRLSAEITGSAVFSLLIERYTGLNAFFYLAGLLTMIFLLRFLRSVEEDLMVENKSVQDVEEGEVVSEVDKKIRGASGTEIDQLDVDEVKVKSGVKFIPAFPVALLVTDVLGGGITWLALIIS